MNISGISSLLSNSAMLQSKQALDAKMQAAVNEANDESGNPLGTSVSFSSPAELMLKLQQLKDSDPDAFKTLMTDLAESLQKAADEAGADTVESKILENMASKTKSVAESGNLSELMPPQAAQAQSGSNQANLAQYLLQGSSSDDETSLLDILMKDDEESTTSTDSTSVSMSSIRDLLDKAFQKMLENKSSSES